MEWREHIVTNPEICHGRACIKGTRVMVTVVLDNLAAGESQEAIAAAYRISKDDIQAALLCAAKRARTVS